MENIDYKKLFDERNFCYYDEYGDIKQYIDYSPFTVEPENFNSYRNMLALLSNYGNAYICQETFTDYVPDITIDNLIGVVKNIVGNVYIEDDETHLCVEFAVMPEKIGKIANDTDLILFYFKDGNINSEKVFVSNFKYKF